LTGYPILILIRLLFFQKFLFKYPNVKTKDDSLKLGDLIKFIALKLNIEDFDYSNYEAFISEKVFNVSNKTDLLIISEKKLFQIDIQFLERKNFHGQLYFLNAKRANVLLFYYKGKENISIDNNPIFPDNIYLLSPGSKILGSGFESIHYNQIIGKYQSLVATKIQLDVENIEFSYKNSSNGIHQLSFNVESGQMIGIIGKSGVGKSTLINLLNGTLKPHSGEIKINNYDLYKEHQNLEGIIGYIPQDDLLVDELSVFDNLYLSSKLCFGNLPEKEIVDKVNNLLSDLNLYSAKSLKVGSPLNKFISGGQRKRLNVALELIREPGILYADEPTSGLSISDADEIMELFSKQAIKGKIVFTNIHQPSSDIFKMFDKILVIDDQGYPVYFGNPADSISYFNQQANKFVKLSDSCDHCNNINHEAIFNILEEKKVDQNGLYINERKTTAIQWHEYYRQNLSKTQTTEEKLDLPKTHFKHPSIFNQFLIFFTRNLWSKVANNQYVALSLLISPFLALILAFLSKAGIDKVTNEYTFSLNENIPAYLFMSVIVSLFIGLIISAEEIYRDKKILKREQFLNLNKPAYLYSKLLFLFLLSFVQTFLFVIIGNSIIEINGMFFQFWLILFTTSCFANTLGLLISMIFNSVVVIYILVPLLIVPQILLSGVVVEFDDLNESVTSNQYVPLIGDVMVSRWSYEALVVTQFKDNKFQKEYFNNEKTASNIRFDILFVIPEIENTLENLRFSDNESITNVELLKSQLYLLDNRYSSNKIFELIGELPDNDSALKLKQYMKLLKKNLSVENNNLSFQKDSITHKLLNHYAGIEGYNKFKNSFYNTRLSEMVLNRNTFEPFVKDGNTMIRKIEPIYQKPISNYGRAHFLSSVKNVKNLEISTLIFNIGVIWIMTVLVFTILLRIFKQKNLIIK
jgi:ABC-type multidrug transport system ATPase subunit